MKELQANLQTEFAKFEATWRAPRQGAEEATKQTLKRLEAGETILFEPNEAVYQIINANNLVGQHDLGFQLDGREHGYQLLHVWKPK